MNTKHSEDYEYAHILIGSPFGSFRLSNYSMITTVGSCIQVDAYLILLSFCLIDNLNWLKTLVGTFVCNQHFKQSDFLDLSAVRPLSSRTSQHYERV